MAASPALARRLLEAMRPHARAGATHVRFSAGSREVQEAAEQAGAKVMVEVAKMEGVLAWPSGEPYGRIARTRALE